VISPFLAQTAAPSLGHSDLLIVAAAGALLLLISYFFGRQENDTAEFFLGNRKIPPLVACLSFVAAETSAVTIVSIPATAYEENWEYIQFFLGLAAARILVAFLFIPVFYRYNCLSIYEFLRHRFGPQTQYAGSVFFLITRLIAAGVRLYAASLGVSLIVGWSLAQTILLFTVVSILFIAFGGIKAVVWAGAYQAVVFFLAGAALLFFLVHHIEGGVPAAWDIARDAGRLRVFNFDFSLNNPTTFWAGASNALFVGLAAFGADQELVQRLLTVKTAKESRRTILATILFTLPVVLIYLAAGTLLFVFYHQNPAVLPPDQPKEVFSHFVANTLPAGLKGFLLAAVILASIDSPLSSLASSFLADLYRPLLRQNASETHYLIISRASVVGFGILLALIAFACEPVQNILWFAFQMVSVTGGAILGVFLLGILTKRSASWGNVLAMITSSLCNAVLLLLRYQEKIDLAWSWLIVLGTLMSFVLSLLFSKRVSSSF